MRIGILDFSLGGLALVRQFDELIPDCDVVYFADTALSPAGDKSLPCIAAASIKGIDFLIAQGATIIVLSSVSASAAIDQQYPNISDVRLINPITACVKEAVQNSPKHRIGVIAERTTIESRIFEKKIVDIDASAFVYSRACPILRPLIEEGRLKKPETVMIVKKYLHPLKVRKVDTLISGSFAYCMLKPVIQRKIGKSVRIVDPVDVVTDYLCGIIKNHSMASNDSGTNRRQFFASDLPLHLQQVAQMMLKKKVTFKPVKI